MIYSKTSIIDTSFGQTGPSESSICKVWNVLDQNWYIHMFSSGCSWRIFCLIIRYLWCKETETLTRSCRDCFRTLIRKRASDRAPPSKRWAVGKPDACSNKVLISYCFQSRSHPCRGSLILLDCDAEQWTEDTYWLDKGPSPRELGKGWKQSPVEFLLALHRGIMKDIEKQRSRKELP